MKNSIIISVLLITLASCNSSNTTKEIAKQTENTKEQMYTCSMHPDKKGQKGDKCPDCGMEMTIPINQTAAENTSKSIVANTGSVKEIMSAYLELKNALTKDNTTRAATAGKILEDAFKKFDQSTLSAEQKKAYADIEDDAREHSEHISSNGGNIEHQREHFVMLSKDIYDLVKVVKVEQKLYKDFCPMANDGKGAIWISETKEIVNPYQGQKMLTCGSVKEEIK